jgi:glycosyltransferase involved in cell wall biosynthesis
MSREPDYSSTERFQLATRLEADACIQADHAFALTEGLRSLMIERGVSADHISVLPNGVDVARFTPAAANLRLRDRLGLRDKVVIGYVGSVVDYEGLELLVDATRILIDGGLPVGLLIVGDGAAMASVKQRVADAGLSDVVVMPGRVPHAEAEAYYSIIDIAPFPRLPLPVTELVSPLKPFEAMAMGKPVVVSSVAALTEIVTDTQNGRVFDKGDVDSLAKVLAALVASAEERERLGVAGREWVVANRSWDTISTRIVEVYGRLDVPSPTP